MLALLDTSEDLATCAEELGLEGRVGQLVTPLNRLARRDLTLPWAIDNGAYSGFDAVAFRKRLAKEAEQRAGCLFVVCPDVVGSARRTLEVFPYWARQLKNDGWPIALAIQDGQQDLPIPWDEIDAVFIGGTTSFKISQHAVHVIRAAQIAGKWVHVGRVNDAHRFAQFEELGVHSIDGTGISRFTLSRERVARRNDQERLALNA
jgi:hypothetical protein